MDDHSFSSSVTPAPLVLHMTNITSPSLSPQHHQSENGTSVVHFKRSHSTTLNSYTSLKEVYTPLMYGGIHNQDDIVGQYLAQQAARKDIMKVLQSPRLDYVNNQAGSDVQSHHFGLSHDSYADGHTQRWYPDPEQIRHFHTLQSLLPHIQPERKLKALSGLELDIVEGHSGNIFCRAVPKKMLILFLGREVISKFLHTVQREDNSAWSGLPTQQTLVLPQKVASAAAITILVSWMTRACRFATMHTMKQIRVPTNLFAACSLTQTMELLGLHKDAHRLDTVISQQFLRRPIYAVEIETLWRCLGETSKYVYGCIRALSSQTWEPNVDEDFRGLAKRNPCLWARICDSEMNELFRPQFGREWFGRLTDGVTECRHETASSVAPTRGSPALPSPYAHAGGSQALDTHTQSVRALDPFAPAFQPMDTAC